MEEQLKADFADGQMVGATQEETGFKCSMGLAKITILRNVFEDIFESIDKEIQ